MALFTFVFAFAFVTVAVEAAAAASTSLTLIVSPRSLVPILDPGDGAEIDASRENDIVNGTWACPAGGDGAGGGVTVILIFALVFR